MLKLIDAASVIRSKNSGPYELTFDIIFKDEAVFKMFCEKKLINKALIAKLYNITEDQVIIIVEFTPSKAIKATIVRPRCSGDSGETDVYGAQQHAPLLGLEFDV